MYTCLLLGVRGVLGSCGSQSQAIGLHRGPSIFFVNRPSIQPCLIETVVDVRGDVGTSHAHKPSVEIPLFVPPSMQHALWLIACPGPVDRFQQVPLPDVPHPNQHRHHEILRPTLVSV